mmetsp:Transcript_117611/g.379611  ORF Transcript_117611/g.379611 Transcript_117611/m.379611 type:complete len:475 (-) Transcript_117611:355-1779(-)
MRGRQGCGRGRSGIRPRASRAPPRRVRLVVGERQSPPQRLQAIRLRATGALGARGARGARRAGALGLLRRWLRASGAVAARAAGPRRCGRQLQRRGQRPLGLGRQAPARVLGEAKVDAQGHGPLAERGARESTGLRLHGFELAHQGQAPAVELALRLQLPGLQGLLHAPLDLVPGAAHELSNERLHSCGVAPGRGRLHAPGQLLLRGAAGISALQHGDHAPRLLQLNLLLELCAHGKEPLTQLCFVACEDLERGCGGVLALRQLPEPGEACRRAGVGSQARGCRQGPPMSLASSSEELGVECAFAELLHLLGLLCSLFSPLRILPPAKVLSLALQVRPRVLCAVEAPPLPHALGKLSEPLLLLTLPGLLGVLLQVAETLLARKSLFVEVDVAAVCQAQWPLVPSRMQTPQTGAATSLFPATRSSSSQRALSNCRRVPGVCSHAASRNVLRCLLCRSCMRRPVIHWLRSGLPRIH